MNQGGGGGGIKEDGGGAFSYVLLYGDGGVVEKWPNVRGRGGGIEEDGGGSFSYVLLYDDGEGGSRRMGEGLFPMCYCMMMVGLLKSGQMFAFIKGEGQLGGSPLYILLCSTID